MNNPVMKFFTVGHLPVPLQDTSRRVCDLASWMDENLPETAQKTLGLQKLMEAKDCFVRAQSELLGDAFDSENQRMRAQEEGKKQKSAEREEPSQTATPQNREPPPPKTGPQEPRAMPRQATPDQAKAAAVGTHKSAVPVGG